MQQSTVGERYARVSASLSPQEIRVVQHILRSGPAVMMRSAARLAEQVGTSDATVLRAVRALGYAGLSELREEVAAQVREPTLDARLRRSVAEAAVGENMLATAIRSQVDSLDLLSEAVSHEAFDEAVRLLTTRARIAWCGTGPSASVAMYAAALSRRIGRPTVALTRTGSAFADELLSVQSGDVIVVLAYGRVQRQISVLLDHAADLGSDVILVTDTLGSRLADRVRVVLRSGRGVPGLLASHVTTIVLVEALTMAIAAADLERAESALRKLNDLRAALAGRRIDTGQLSL